MNAELTPRGRKKEPMTLRFQLDLLQRARAIAKKRKVTLTSVLEVCLEYGLPKLERGTP